MIENTTTHQPMAVGCRARNKRYIDNYNVHTQSRSPRYVEERRATSISEYTTVRGSTNCSPAHIYEEKQSEGKRNVAYHTRRVNRVPQLLLGTKEIHRFRPLLHKRDKSDRPSNRNAQIDRIPIDGLVLRTWCASLLARTCRMIVRCRDLCGDSERRSEGVDTAVYLHARLVLAFRSGGGGRRIRLGFDVLVWRQRWFRFGGGGDNAFRSCRDRVSYLWIFRMPGNQISLLVGDRLVLRVGHSNGRHNKNSTNRSSTCKSASSPRPSMLGTTKSRPTVAVSSANNSTILPTLGRHPKCRSM